MKYLKSLQEVINERFNLKSIINEKINSRPSIFSHTIYRLPTEEELIDLNTYQLKSDDILEGFKYSHLKDEI